MNQLTIDGGCDSAWHLRLPSPTTHSDAKCPSPAAESEHWRSRSIATQRLPEQQIEAVLEAAAISVDQSLDVMLHLNNAHKSALWRCSELGCHDLFLVFP